ncbi:MAG: hypothetical protein KAZ12_03250 [Paludibacteraceae bacterium]|nr:hypothetical protein [Paludibacteraceae bacterium]
MKKITLLLICFAITFSSYSQQAASKGSSIALKVIVEDLPDPFPTTAKVQVINKLNMLITKNGIASGDLLNRFFITVIATPLTKDITPTAPVQIAQTLEMTFYVADYYDKKIFATTSVVTKGVGTNETKSYMDAIKHINVNSPVLAKFIDEGKVKIIDYYNSQAEIIFLQVKALVGQKKFEEALYLLTSIPAECDKYSESLDLSISVYQQYIDYLCDVNLALAKSTWMAQQNSAGAEATAEYLSQIYPDAKCYGDAQLLYAEIKGKVLDDWKFEMKKWQDGVDLESQRINAFREVGVAYGQGQQPTTTNIGWLR